MDDRTTDLANSLRPAILRLGRRLRQEPCEGLTALDGSLLFTISTNPGILLSVLAEREGMSRPSMSAHLKRIEENGWISRKLDKNDRRSQGLHITTLGKKSMAAVKSRRNDWLIAQLETLSDKDLKALSAATNSLSLLAGLTP